MQYHVILWALLLFNICLEMRGGQAAPDLSLKAKEAALGATLAAQVRRQTTPLGVASVDSYIKKLSDQLIAQIPNAPEDWKWSVIRDHQNSSTGEPLSLPGGWIFVPAQLFLAVHDEAELAGMLAHAMAHVAERQQIRQTPGDGNPYSSITLLFMGGPAGFGGDENTLVPASFLKTQREYELQADRDAVRTMAAAGFDPHALLNYIARVQPERTGKSQEFSPLPPLSIRLGNLQQAIQNAPVIPLRSSDNSFQSTQTVVRQSINMAAPAKVHRIPSLLHPDNE